MEYGYKEEFGLNWGNTIAALRWNHLFGQKLFSNFTATYSRYNFNLYSESEDRFLGSGGEVETENFSQQYFSGIEDVAVKADFDYYPSPANSIKFGTSAIYHTFKPGAQQYATIDIDTLFGTSNIEAVETATYIENDFRPGDNFSLNAGLHFSSFHVNGKSYTSLQPRLSLRYQLGNGVALKASYAQMAQFVHLLTNVGVGLPTDLWVPATDDIAPQEATQYAIGAAKTIGKFNISAELYYKQMQNLIAYKEGASFINLNTTWEDQVTVGNGDAYGLELLVQKKIGRTTGWLGYTLSRSNRQFDELNFGNEFPYKYDRRHDISLTSVHKLSERVSLSAAWVYGTGQAATLPLQAFAPSPTLNQPLNNNRRFFGDANLHYGERNSFRFRAYHRFDIGAAFHKDKKWGTRTWRVGVYNLYSRRNPFFIERRYNFETDREEFVEFSLFPIVPSVSYGFKF